ncbi:sensor histidine kinase [Azospirillum sp.]|uniref:sensor histidine kinase n=1 Tax=Azospirillum sp. TaxID=34012 RepID=UPI002D69E6BF|nr:ATP-binding protein [Azospirillum sp.]HYD71396.1 ATP-binding protein [Azospirillum sp.]
MSAFAQDPEVPHTPSDTDPPAVTRQWYIALILTMVLPLVALALLLDDDGRPSELTPHRVHEAAVAVAGEGAGAPAAWRTVTLPFRCPAAWEEDPCSGVFRVIHRHDPADDRPLSLYIPSYRGNLTVSLNGTPVASSHWDKGRGDVSGTIPLLVVLPAPLLRPGDNVFEIALVQAGVVSRFLDRVAIGPDDELRPDYGRRVFLFSTLARMLDGWQVAMGLALLIIWLARPRERVFLVFAGVLLFHVTASFPAILGDLPPDWVLRLANAGRFFGAFFVVPLTYLLVGRRPPVGIGVFLLGAVATVALLFLASPQAFVWTLTTILTPLVLGLLAWGIGVVARAAFRNRNAEAMLLAGSLLVALVLAAHDALVLRGALGDGRVMLGRFAAPLVLTAISAILVWRFGRTMTVLDAFSARLKRDVAAAEDAVRRSFEREQEQARLAVLQGERVRLMSDLHDGIAGQLVGILSLCELRGDGPDEVTDTVRAALADLRLIVASLDDYGDDLGVMLGVLRERIEPQAAAHGITLSWRMAELPELHGLHPGAVLAIFRILQEAVTNACRHSGAGTLAFAAGPSPRPGFAVRLCLRDDGRGGAAGRPGGQGLRNMRRRAETLGATLDIVSAPDGTAVTLDLPERLP